MQHLFHRKIDTNFTHSLCEGSCLHMWLLHWVAGAQDLWTLSKLKV
jgi:hypothetical protein